MRNLILKSSYAFILKISIKEVEILELDTKNIYDLIIIGGGPAGLTAAIYMARAKYKTLVLEKEKFGGQITITSEIVNYPGILNTTGSALTSDMQKQAESFGAEFKMAEVLDLDLSSDIKTVKTSIGEYKALSIILALGASPRKAGFDGEREFSGRGVGYCATCDGEFFTNKPIYVVGGGFAAIEEAMFLTKYSSNIHLLVRGENFTAAQSIVEHLNDFPQISISFNTEVLSVSGENNLTKIKIKNNKTDAIIENSHPDGFGVFVFAGYIPNTSWLSKDIEKKDGYIMTSYNQETNIAGVYAAGDVCLKDLRQVVTAVSDGAKASTSAEKYVSKLHTKLNLPAFDMPKVAKIEKNNPKENISSDNDDKFINSDIRAQLTSIFSKFQNKVIVNAVLDDSSLANEMLTFTEELNGISDKVICYSEKAADNTIAPYLELLFEDNSSSGIKFFAMPGGHEFNSFIIALYNVAGPGKEISQIDFDNISNLNKSIDIKVLISLSCTLCPDMVMATQKIASLNKNITASAIDINQFPALKEKYNVMSVPCTIINDSNISFGKKSITELLQILKDI